MSAPRERMASTLLLAYASSGVSQLANQGFFFILLRYAAIESVGIYSWAIAVATIYTYVMDLGLSPFLVRELSSCQYRLKTVLLATLVLRAPVLLLGGGALAVWAILRPTGSAELWTLGLVLLAYIVQMVDGGLVPWFQARHRQNAANLLALVVPLGRLASVVAVLLLYKEVTLAQVVWISLLTQVAGTCCLILGARRCQARLPAATDNGPAEGSVRQLLRNFRARGPGLAVMYSLNVLQARLDWILVSALISHVALASYSVANKVVEMAMLVAAIWARTSFPWLSRAGQDTGLQQQLGFLRRLFIISCGFTGIMLFFWSPPLLEMFFGTKYVDARVSLGLLTMATAFFMLNQYFLYDLLSLGLEKSYTLIIAAVSLGQVAINVILLPRIGVEGAALALMVTGVLMHAGQMLLLVRAGQLVLREVVRMEVFIITLAGGLAAAWVFHVSVLPGTASMFGLAAVLGLTLILQPGDKERLSALWRQARQLLGSASPGS